MINATFFGINVLLLIAIWNFMLKKTILDHYRNQLFDLRDEVREYFLQNEVPLDSIAYKNLRDLLNGHLRFTERVTFSKFVVMEAEIQNNKNLQEYLKADFEKRFDTQNEKLKEYVPQVRERARVILFNHMINSSGMIWLLAISLSPFMIAWNMLRMLKQLLSTGFATLTDGLLSSLGKAVKLVFAINSPFGNLVKQDLLEESSYRFGTASSEYTAAGC